MPDSHQAQRSLSQGPVVFELKRLIPIVESACKAYGGMDFNAAAQEYDQTYDLMELFHTSDPGSEAEAESEDEDALENNFQITEFSRVLIDGSVWLAGQLLKHPACGLDDREALAKALLGLARLPRSTPGMTVDFGFSIDEDSDIALRHWSVHLDETEIMWSAGGCIRGLCGSDSFTSFQLSLLRGSEDTAMGNVDAWLELKEYVQGNIDISVIDASDETFWDRHSPRVRPNSTWRR